MCCLKTRLKSCSQYFKQDELMYHRIFDDPDAMEAKTGFDVKPYNPKL